MTTVVTMGRMVVVKGAVSNGSDEHPAIVTKAHGIVDLEAPGATMYVNLCVFLDADTPRPMTSIPMFVDRERAMAFIESQRRTDLMTSLPTVAFFPDRV